MYKTSTVFIKGQLPGITVADLLMLYKKELQNQNVSNISIDEEAITFRNDMFTFTQYSTRLSGFSRGRISIADNDTEFIIWLEADLTRLFENAGLVSGLATLAFLLTSGYNPGVLIFGLAVFITLAAFNYIAKIISFPVYFTSLRNDIERELQNLK